MSLNLINSTVKSKVLINPNDGFKVQKNTGTTGAPVWSDQISLDSSGNALFGGVLSIGSGGAVVKADSNTGLWVGASAFASAPFRVDLNGTVTASRFNLTGGTMNINNKFIVDSSGNLTASGNIAANALVSGSYIQAPTIMSGTISIGSGRFSVDINGNVYANNGTFVSGSFSGNITSTATIEGGNLKGATIDGGKINITTDISVGNNVYVGTNDTQTGKSIWFRTGTSMAVIGYNSSYAQIYLSAMHGVNINGGDLYVNDDPVATQAWVRQNIVAKWG
ncbi:hypothetical protein J4772_27470 [Cohnella sp. LGH]|uniref:hypothetical protein n=1 Tax=Cohnella sp. LGH TaxID=1619153 RepID=UPI001AD9B825|nr:hypothetical protein [Cohnella sp. LGH]QTH41261.1 hypothetical protein J4772_27470 [Cohnella sp. LGH]